MNSSKCWFCLMLTLETHARKRKHFLKTFTVFLVFFLGYKSYGNNLRKVRELNVSVGSALSNMHFKAYIALMLLFGVK